MDNTDFSSEFPDDDAGSIFSAPYYGDTDRFGQGNIDAAWFLWPAGVLVRLSDYSC